MIVQHRRILVEIDRGRFQFQLPLEAVSRMNEYRTNYQQFRMGSSSGAPG